MLTTAPPIQLNLTLRQAFWLYRKLADDRPLEIRQICPVPDDDAVITQLHCRLRECCPPRNQL